MNILGNHKSAVCTFWHKWVHQPGVVTQKERISSTPPSAVRALPDTWDVCINIKCQLGIIHPRYNITLHTAVAVMHHLFILYLLVWLVPSAESTICILLCT